MAYGFRSRRKSAASTYRRTTVGVRTPFARRNLGKTKYFKSATARRLNTKETKYDDDYFNLNTWTKYNSSTTGTGVQGPFTDWVLGGVMSTSSLEFASVMGNGGTTFAQLRTKLETKTPNCLTNIDSGTTASTRIGNAVEPKYITIKGVCTAALTTDAEDPETIEKLEGATTDTLISRFMRTTVRVMVIRDKSMNEKGYVEFSDVFGPPTSTTANQSAMAATNPFLWNRKLDTIGRYEILKQDEWTLDQNDPQQSFSWTVPLKGIRIRFNGSTNSIRAQWNANSVNINGTSTPAAYVEGGGSFVTTTQNTDTQSMTNGIYILAVAHSGNTGSDTSVTVSPSVIFSTRCGFYDN